MLRMYLFCVFVSLTLVGTAQTSISPRVREIVNPVNESKEVHLYLLAGQSNMAGSSPIEPSDTIPHNRILRFNQDYQWEIAKEPLRVDKSIVGMGPGLSFARELVKRDTTIIVGLIPAAVGGTSISLWEPGAFDTKTKLYPYDQAIDRALSAMRSGELKGIIWNQGESDSNKEGANNYQQKLNVLIERFRKDLGIDNLPFVAGLLSKFKVVKKVQGRRQVNRYAQAVNSAILDLKDIVKNYEVVKLKNAKDKGDGTHLDSKSARALGKEYAQAVLNLGKN
ncbi:sialate O-acetylesterase [Cytophaga sp. FL35]|uniref:sialate O-acetylesterase n=1 Tax=Cytophaga sp. FL35 TaxID=1904456 RepID=UPI0016534D93|nr:sialate O-acetylesterase [Cytophaga sp. FL35]MBC7000322.1 sialate O-acetylesterase [Cytophaga sp. FL35]